MLTFLKLQPLVFSAWKQFGQFIGFIIKKSSTTHLMFMIQKIYKKVYVKEIQKSICKGKRVRKLFEVHNIFGKD